MKEHFTLMLQWWKHGWLTWWQLNSLTISRFHLSGNHHIGMDAECLGKHGHTLTQAYISVLGPETPGEEASDWIASKAPPFFFKFIFSLFEMLVYDNSYIMVWGNFHIKVTFSIYVFFLLMFKMILGLDFIFHLSLGCVNILLVIGVHPNLLTNYSFIFHADVIGITERKFPTVSQSECKFIWK